PDRRGRGGCPAGASPGGRPTGASPGGCPAGASPGGCPAGASPGGRPAPARRPEKEQTGAVALPTSARQDPAARPHVHPSPRRSLPASARPASARPASRFGPPHVPPSGPARQAERLRDAVFLAGAFFAGVFFADVFLAA